MNSLADAVDEDDTVSPFSGGVMGEIQRDIVRTYPMHPFFSSGQSSGQVMLGRVLRAIARLHKEVGYCQVSFNSFYCYALCLQSIS